MTPARLSEVSSMKAEDQRARVLRDRIGPDDPRYAALVGRGFNKRFAGKPDYVRLVQSADDVIDAVQDAVREQRRVVARGGGHCLEGFVDDPDARVIIDTSLMTGVRGGRALVPPARILERLDLGASLRPIASGRCSSRSS